VKVEYFYDADRGAWVVSLGANGYRNVFQSEELEPVLGVYAYLNVASTQVLEAVWNQAAKGPIIAEESIP